MSTFGELVDQVTNQLMGFVGDQEQQTYLTGSMDTDDLTFTVDEPDLVSRGLVQVGSELMWVRSVDTSTATVTVSPFGRGYQSSGAATHASGAMVTDNPSFPRFMVKKTINQVMEMLYPDLYVLATENLTYTAAQVTYELPAAARGVTQVTWDSIGPSQVWPTIQRWEFNPRANTTDFPSGKSIDIWSMIVPGRTVKVDYYRRPDALVDETDDFTDSGLEEYVETCVMYGTCHRLVGYLDVPRLQTRSPETSQRSTYVQAGAASDAAKYFYALYTEALSQARTRFLRENPVSIHFKGF